MRTTDAEVQQTLHILGHPATKSAKRTLEDSEHRLPQQAGRISAGLRMDVAVSIRSEVSPSGRFGHWLRCSADYLRIQEKKGARPRSPRAVCDARLLNGVKRRMTAPVAFSRRWVDHY